MHFVKPNDLEYPVYSKAIADAVRQTMTILKLKKPGLDGERWVQEATMLTLLDGAATIAASVGYPPERIANWLTEVYAARKVEMMGAADGGLKVPHGL